MYTGIVFILPEIIISVMSCLILLCDLFLSKAKKSLNYYLTQATLLLTIISLFYLIDESKCILFHGAFVFDFSSFLLKVFVILFSFVVFIYSKKYLQIMGLFKGEYFVLCLLSILGMMIMISSGTFLSLYLGLELLSLPIYSLIIMNKDFRSAEASMKFFIMGSIASGIFLFGVSIVYGMTGVIELYIANAVIVSEEAFSDITLQYGLVFLISGLIFKFGAVPFHMWVPDVYEGSPIPVTIFIGTVPKFAALGMAYRLLVDTFSSLNDEFEFLFIVVGVLSLFIGNIFALSQTDIKRLLGYSAISHVGFVFCGFVVSDAYEFTAVIFYIMVYVISSMGAFGIIMVFSSKDREANLISQFNGLIFVYPTFSVLMLLFLFSLAGIPPTAGFYAKFLVLKSLMSYGYIELSLFAIFMSVVGAFYYLSIVKTMFFCKVNESTLKVFGLSYFGLFLLFLNGILIIFIGLFPSLFLQFCHV